jgi:hypothetical protein
MSCLTLILAQDHLTWKHANIVLSGQTDLSINGWAIRTMSRLHTFVAFIVIAAGFSGCSDIDSSSHATRAAASQDIERGWIPSVLPDSAVQICESHNLDTNVGHGSFGFGASDSDLFRAGLTPLRADQSVRAHRATRSDFERRGYTFYRYEDFEIAVDWSRHIGEFWLVFRR